MKKPRDTRYYLRTMHKMIDKHKGLRRSYNAPSGVIVDVFLAPMASMVANAWLNRFQFPKELWEVPMAQPGSPLPSKKDLRDLHSLISTAVVAPPEPPDFHASA